MLCLADFEAHAKGELSKNAWEHYATGADEELTLKDNLKAFSR